MHARVFILYLPELTLATSLHRIIYLEQSRSKSNREDIDSTMLTKEAKNEVDDIRPQAVSCPCKVSNITDTQRAILRRIIERSEDLRFVLDYEGGEQFVFDSVRQIALDASMQQEKLDGQRAPSTDAQRASPR